MGDIKELEKYCIKSSRLKHDKREQIPLEYLAQKAHPRFYNNLDMLKELLLCFDKLHHNYQHLSEGKKKLADKLSENEEIVNITVCTLFQWFGTNCGSCDIREIIKEIDSIDHLGKVIK